MGLAVAAGTLALALGMAGRGDAAAGPATGMFCCGLPLLVVIVAVIAIALNILYELALRYGVLMDVSFGQAIRRAWGDLVGRKGAIAFWAVMILPGIAFGLIVAALFTPLALLAVLLAYSEQYLVLGAVVAVLIIVSLAVSAVYSTFSSFGVDGLLPSHDGHGATRREAVALRLPAGSASCGARGVAASASASAEYRCLRAAGFSSSARRRLAISAM